MKAFRTLLYITIGIIIAAPSCQNGNKNSAQQTTDTLTKVQQTYSLEFAKPFNNDNIKKGEQVNIEMRTKDASIFDSIQIKIENQHVTTLVNSSLKFQWNSKNGQLGQQSIVASAYSKGSKIIETATTITILPNKKPIQYNYKIIKTYPHSRDAYTQGLIYENGYFYESDGEYKKSALRKVKLETGQATIVTNMEPSIFGEGLAIYNNKLYQISWKEHIGFIYNKETLKLEKKFNFDLNEGWGLEFDGKNFLATDGSSNIYFLEPENFTQVGKIQVVTDNGPIDSINELELINGKLYANVYYQDIVLIIDPKTGEVLGEINFANILPKSDYNEDTNVLNGIAWNPVNGHLFITGKNWPKLFEVEILK